MRLRARRHHSRLQCLASGGGATAGSGGTSTRAFSSFFFLFLLRLIFFNFLIFNFYVIEAKRNCFGPRRAKTISLWP